MYNYDLSIIIVSYNSCKILIQCIESIYQFSEDLKIQILISDNASSDDTVDMLNRKFPTIRIIRNDKNLGFAKANNRALPYCVGRYILYLNPDVILIEPLLKRMIHFLEKNEDAGAVGCKLINLDGSFQKSYSQKYPTVFNRFLEATYIEKLIQNMKNDKLENNRPLKVASITGACILIPTSIIEKLNGFDERFFMYCEDIDLCYRIYKLGLNIYYLGGLKMIHYEGGITENNKKSYFTKVLTKESVYKYFLKYGGKYKALIYRYSMIFASLVRLVILLPIVIFTFFINSKRVKRYRYAMLKYFKVVSWGFGFEAWTKDPC